MSHPHRIRASREFIQSALISTEDYARDYRASVQHPEQFWSAVGQRLLWQTAFTEVKDVSFELDDFRIRWFADGKLNVAENCLDRHLATRANKTAIIWQPDDPNQASKHLSYLQLHDAVCRFANALQADGVKRGDRVTIYLPMIPEAAIAMLACARIGAIHSVVFGGFSAESLAGRIDDCGSDVIITSDQAVRGGKIIELKNNVDAAIAKLAVNQIRRVIVVQHTGGKIQWHSARDSWYHELVAHQSNAHHAQAMDAEAPLFILYTSGSTGKPKGVLHTTGGYLAYASYTHECVFDLREDDIYFCTADVGWVTGHSYVVYGPLSNGATTLMFEGVPNYPDSSRFWQIIDQHQVTIFYTAPTAIRALMREGDAPVQKCSRASLRLLGSVGEPINPEAWLWYYRVVGDSRCPIVDTWWQTETGGILISPLAGAMEMKPGSASLPFFGIEPAIVDASGIEQHGECEGNLVLKNSWPGQMRSVYGDHQRFIDTYFKTYPGTYFTGDGCKRDADGFYWITGRVDDVINVSGHRLGTAEIESALVAHHTVAESAVVGFPHDIKGQGIYAFVTLKLGISNSDELRAELNAQVRQDIGAIALPDFIQWAPSLPKTRSGKIMRRILRKIAANELDNLGDISTLADPAVVEQLIQTRLVKK